MATDALAKEWRGLAERFRRIANNSCSEADVKATAAICGLALPRMRDAGLIPANLILEPPAAELQEHVGQPDVISDFWSTCWTSFLFAISHPRINPGFPIPNPVAFKSERRGGPEQVTVGSTGKADWRIRAENYAVVCEAMAGAVSDDIDKGDTQSTAARALEALMGVEDSEILKIAHSDASADDRMRAIYRIDSRVLAWDSRRWADLLGTSGAAIRKSPWWKVDRVAILARQRDDD